jgi:hypothetical protein
VGGGGGLVGRGAKWVFVGGTHSGMNTIGSAQSVYIDWTGKMSYQ